MLLVFNQASEFIQVLNHSISKENCTIIYWAARNILLDFLVSVSHLCAIYVIVPSTFAL